MPNSRAEQEMSDTPQQEMPNTLQQSKFFQSAKKKTNSLHLLKCVIIMIE